ncbi:unnamed protein product [Strongylus vulgaris]|uniref:Uncharacterized protein n=1 Tax=Strongylus vulgaris TaxID=40348 RepID=A0A3P7JRN7_STRVU|nr:unnamed protein product [Strongylus vulgaris]
MPPQQRHDTPPTAVRAGFTQKPRGIGFIAPHTPQEYRSPYSRRAGFFPQPIRGHRGGTNRQGVATGVEPYSMRQSYPPTMRPPTVWRGNRGHQYGSREGPSYKNLPPYRRF